MTSSIKTLVMNFVQSRGIARRKDIIQFICECKGEKFDPIRDRGFWSTAFVTPHCRNMYKLRGYDKDIHTNYTDCGYFMKPSKNEHRFLIQDKPYGPYRVVTFKQGF